MDQLRVGQGYDVHAFVENRPLKIGGVEIAHDRGLAGHSDADVLLHAIMDALLGAAGLGDIGWHFPPTDMKFKDANSVHLMARVKELISSAGYKKIINVDATIIAEKPKFSPFIQAMREKIAGVLEIESTRVNIKATTTEKLGFVGREEGIAAMAVCLISSDG